VYQCSDGGHYKGDWYAGQRHGYGTEVSADGDTYDGNWFNDQKHGNNGTWTHVHSGMMWKSALSSGATESKASPTANATIPVVGCGTEWINGRPQYSATRLAIRVPKPPKPSPDELATAASKKGKKVPTTPSSAGSGGLPSLTPAAGAPPANAPSTAGANTSANAGATGPSTVVGVAPPGTPSRLRHTATGAGTTKKSKAAAAAAAAAVAAAEAAAAAAAATAAAALLPKGPARVTECILTLPATKPVHPPQHASINSIASVASTITGAGAAGAVNSPPGTAPTARTIELVDLDALRDSIAATEKAEADAYTAAHPSRSSTARAEAAAAAAAATADSDTLTDERERKYSLRGIVPGQSITPALYICAVDELGHVAAGEYGRTLRLRLVARPIQEIVLRDGEELKFSFCTCDKSKPVELAAPNTSDSKSMADSKQTTSSVGKSKQQPSPLSGTTLPIAGISSLTASPKPNSAGRRVATGAPSGMANLSLFANPATSGGGASARGSARQQAAAAQREALELDRLCLGTCPQTLEINRYVSLCTAAIP
jgi:hypothetical protein